MRRNERIGDPMTMLRAALNGLMSELWVSLPAVVESVDLVRQTVTVQPTIRSRVTLEGGVVTSIDFPLIPDVPIVFPSGGGYSLTFPIEPGDECLVVFADRCIDAWWQSGGVQEQADYRMHDLSDGFAIFGPRSQPRALPSVSAGAVQLRSDDGMAYVEVSDAGITLKHGAAVTIDAPATTITGPVTMPAGATIGGVPFGTHHHTGVRSGTDTSGGPV